MNSTAEFTFPLAGFSHAKRTNIAKRKLSNKDAALLILAANGGVMRVPDVKTLLRGWRPLDGYGGQELHFTYLFNEFYGHITENYDAQPFLARPGYSKNNCYGRSKAHYSVGPYMWRPFAHRAAISALGRARLNYLVASAKASNVCLLSEVVEGSSPTA